MVITFMTERDNDFIDAEVPGYIKFAKDGLDEHDFTTAYRHFVVRLRDELEQHGTFG